MVLRSLYELNLNLSEIDDSSDREDAAKKFVRFGKFQKARLEQRHFEDQIRDEKSKPQPTDMVLAEYEQKLADNASLLDRSFAEFRNSKGKRKWQESWSGVNVETLAKRVATKTGGQRGETDYFVFRLGSLFTHSAPGAFLLGLRDPETSDWSEFRAGLDDAGRNGLRQFLYEASACLVDIVGMAGDSIVGYDPQWFHECALRLLQKF